MVRTSTRHPRPSKKMHRYRPKIVNLSELRKKPMSDPVRVIHVQSPFYEQMVCGEKTVESRPNYPCFRDLQPGTVVEFSHNFSGESFLARITHRRVSRDFVTMLRKESIQSCLPDHDPEDLQRAVNTYHAFRNGTYKFIAKKHGVVSLRFTVMDNNRPSKPSKQTISYCGEYDRNSLCSIFEAIDRKIFERKFGFHACIKN